MIRISRRRAEANARRKVAKAWAKTGSGITYKCAATREAYLHVEEQVYNEAFDGFLLSLSASNSHKSMSAQKRILRRIIEKRQAQAVHRYIGHSEDRLSEYLSLAYGKRCAKELYGFHNISTH